MKIFGIELANWHEHKPYEWVRNQEGKLFAPVSIYRIYSENGYTLYPIFSDQLEFVQKIYNASTNCKEFPIDKIQEAQEFVDQFLFQLEKLKVFL